MIRFFIFLILPFQIIAQEQLEIDWSMVEKDPGFVNIVSAKDGNPIVQVKGKSDYINKNQFFISRFDSSMLFSTSISLGELSKKEYYNVETVDSPDGVGHIYAVPSKNSKSLQIFVQLFDHENLDKNGKFNLFKFKIRSKVVFLNVVNGKKKLPLPISVIQSKDRSKVCIFLEQDKVGKKKLKNIQYAVFDILHDFKLLHSGDFDTPEKYNKYTSPKRILSDNGLFLVLLKTFNHKNTRQTKNKRPDFNYELHFLNGIQSNFIYDIKQKKYFIDDLDFSVDKNDEVFLSGSLRLKSRHKVIGNYILRLNKNGVEIFEVKDRFKQDRIYEITNKRGDYISKYYNLSKVLTNSNLCYVVLQYMDEYSDNNRYRSFYNPYNPYNSFSRSRRYNSNRNNNEDTYFEYRSTLVFAYDKLTGEKSWVSVLPRKQIEIKTYSEPLFLEGDMKILGDEFYMFYNETDKNISRLIDGKSLRSTSIEHNRTLPTMVKIDVTGEQTISTLDAESRLNLINRGSFVNDSKLYFLEQSNDFNQYRIGLLY